MTGKEVFGEVVKVRYKTIKVFAVNVGISYSTLLFIFNHNLSAATVGNVVAICYELGISLDALFSRSAPQGHAEQAPLILATDEETRVIKGYRVRPEYRPAVNHLLCEDMKVSAIATRQIGRQQFSLFSCVYVHNNF